MCNFKKLHSPQLVIQIKCDFRDDLSESAPAGRGLNCNDVSRQPVPSKQDALLAAGFQHTISHCLPGVTDWSYRKIKENYLKKANEIRESLAEVT